MRLICLLVMLSVIRTSSFAPNAVSRGIRNNRRRITRRSIKTSTIALRWGEKDDDDDASAAVPRQPPSSTDSDEFSFSRPRKSTPSSSSSSSSSAPRRSSDDEGRRYRSREPDSDNRSGRNSYNDRRGPPRNNGGDRRGPPRNNSGDRRGPPRNNNNNNNGDRDRNFTPKEKEGPRINLRHLESLGFEHLFGLSPVLNALKSGRRFSTPPTLDLASLEEYESDKVKPSTILFVQEKTFQTSGRTDPKEKLKSSLLTHASNNNIPISYLDKGTLNSLSSNRPHQGFVLRCPELTVPPTQPSDIFNEPKDLTSPKLWLALDSVLDPVNLGSIIRTSSFLSKDISILTCLKNSAPLSPVVSSTSAGAMELVDLKVCNNMVHCLMDAKEKGWRILIADAKKSGGEYDERSVKEWEWDVPTVLVLGSEGDGVRSVVKRCCDGVVSVDGGGEDVDSLNVSVSAGILIHHFMGRA
ncbi:hypothetical protein TrVE_jg9813 [Triparma verrucosa]|uniref:rRNA methyltransferase 1, mitochondrial n=1 Tax=Triparma verrucosa TaxID=1606542 RepID=A0A9W7F3A6_9STRA|nr:hypothetical protein TrVE_jg9813 [Triparma verrucosa]